MLDSSSIRTPFLPLVLMAFVRTYLRRSAERQVEVERKWLSDWLLEHLQQSKLRWRTAASNWVCPRHRSKLR